MQKTALRVYVHFRCAIESMPEKLQACVKACVCDLTACMTRPACG